MNKRNITMQRPHHVPPPSNPAAGWVLPSKGGRTMILGMALVGSGFGLFFANLHRRQAKREERDIIAPGSVPTWQYRIKQAGEPVDNPEHPLTIRQRHHAERDKPLLPINREQNNAHTTISKYLASESASEEGRRMQPAPQRSRGDGSGRAYTKAPSYNDSYEKHEKHHKRTKLGGGRTKLEQDEESLQV